MLKNFRLVSRDDIAKMSSTPVIYALCFDVDGLLVKIGWTKDPWSRLVTLIHEQAVEPKEIWLADYRPEYRHEWDSYDLLQGFARRFLRAINHAHIHHGFFRLTMTAIDNAFSEVTGETVPTAGKPIDRPIEIRLRSTLNAAGDVAVHVDSNEFDHLGHRVLVRTRQAA